MQRIPWIPPSNLQLQRSTVHFVPHGRGEGATWGCNEMIWHQPLFCLTAIEDAWWQYVSFLQKLHWLLMASSHWVQNPEDTSPSPPWVSTKTKVRTCTHHQKIHRKTTIHQKFHQHQVKVQSTSNSSNSNVFPLNHPIPATAGRCSFGYQGYQAMIEAAQSEGVTVGGPQGSVECLTAAKCFMALAYLDYFRLYRSKVERKMHL